MSAKKIQGADSLIFEMKLTIALLGNHMRVLDFIKNYPKIYSEFEDDHINELLFKLKEF